MTYLALPSKYISNLITWASLITQLVKNPTAMQEAGSESRVGVICWRRDRLPTPVFSGFPCCSAGLRIRLPCGRPGFSPWVEKIPWRRERLPTHFSILAWRILWTTVHGIAKSRTGLRDFHFLSNVLVQTTLPLDC